MPEFFDQSLDDIIKKGRRAARGRSQRGKSSRNGAGRFRGSSGSRGQVRRSVDNTGVSSSSRGGRRRPARGLVSASRRGAATGVFRSARAAGGVRRRRQAKNRPAASARNNSAKWPTTAISSRAVKNNKQSTLKRKQLTTRLNAGGVKKGRPVALQTSALRTKRLAALALASKKRALQQLTRANQQLQQADARNQLLMKRRNIATTTQTTSAAKKRNARNQLTAGVLARGGAARRRQLMRSSGNPAAAANTAPSVGGVVYYNQQFARGRQPVRLARGGRFRLNRAAIGAPVNFGALAQRSSNMMASGGAPYTAGFSGGARANSMLTVQIKNESHATEVHQPAYRPVPYDPENASMNVGRAKLNRSALNPHIQQEIAAIQARGRSQRLSAAAGATNNIPSSAPTKPIRASVATSGRTLNERFTQDRVIYS